MIDVHLAQAALARAVAERSAGEAEYAIALGALRGLLGLEEPVTVHGDLGAPSPLDESALAASADQRPELRVLEAAIREAEADVALATTMTKPDYGVGVRYQREATDRIVVGALTVTLPVFSKGQELRMTGTARASRLRAQLEATRARVRIELRTALDAYRSRLAAASGLATGALPVLEETEALTTRSFDVGQIGLPDVLVIRRELL